MNSTKKAITVKREPLDFQSSQKNFIISNMTLAEAARSLNGTELKLYLYLLSNDEGYNRDFSSQHFSSIYGCSRTATMRAFDGLIQKKYLVIEDGIYCLYERPRDGKSRELLEFLFSSQNEA